MESIVFWQQGASDGEVKLAAIKEWWTNLANKDILWQQRTVPDDRDLSKINWEMQKFDEEFTFAAPELRGITLYWQKTTERVERNITPVALRLDRASQTLEIMPDSSRNYLVRVTSREPMYQFTTLMHPIGEYTKTESGAVLVFKSEETMTAVEVILSDAQINTLINAFSQAPIIEP